MPKPKVDDQYWFDLSQKLVDGGQTSRDAAALKLQNLALWLWGIYTASAAIGFTLAAKPISLQMQLLIASASAALIAIYWMSVWIQMPVALEFDPRAPAQIRKAYDEGVYIKSRRLHLALACSLPAAALVALALVTASIGTAQPDLQADGRTQDGKTAVAILARVPPNSSGRYEVREVVDPKSSKAGTPATGLFRTFSAGTLQVSVQVPSTTLKFDVIVEWNEAGGLKHMLTRRITLDQTAGH